MPMRQSGECLKILVTGRRRIECLGRMRREPLDSAIWGVNAQRHQYLYCPGDFEFTETVLERCAGFQASSVAGMANFIALTITVWPQERLGRLTPIDFKTIMTTQVALAA